MTPAYIRRVRKLHKKVIHNKRTIPSDVQISTEDRQIKRIDYNELSLICKSCFREPK